MGVFVGRRGYSLVELLVALAILGALMGSLALGFAGGSPEGTEDQRCVKAAHEAVQWLRGMIVRARAESRAFQLQVSVSSNVDRLEIFWLDDNRWERFNSAGRVYFKANLATNWVTYQPRWHTFSPGLTLWFYKDRSSRLPVGRIVITPLGAVNLTVF